MRTLQEKKVRPTGKSSNGLFIIEMACLSALNAAGPQIPEDLVGAKTSFGPKRATASFLTTNVHTLMSFP